MGKRSKNKVKLYVVTDNGWLRVVNRTEKGEQLAVFSTIDAAKEYLEEELFDRPWQYGLYQATLIRAKHREGVKNRYAKGLLQWLGCSEKIINRYCKYSDGESE